jgi:hypothetical protein
LRLLFNKNKMYNVYAESLAETKSKGEYEQSVAALSPTTYQQANKQNFLLAKWYANLYHGISAGLGLACYSMYACFYLFGGGWQISCLAFIQYVCLNLN